MQNMRALVVDDSKVGRLTMQKKLESLGISVDLAESGLEALSYLERCRPDLIFMDHMMPELDGFEATRRIKSAPATQDIPVIIISGSDDETFVRDARAIGADGVIAKPPTTEVIERILTSLPRLGTAPVEAASPAPSAQQAAPMQPVAVPDRAAMRAMIEDLLGQALQRLRSNLLETIRTEWTAAIEQERQARQTGSAQIEQRLENLAAAQAESTRAGAEAQAAQLSELASRLAALEDAARQTAAPPVAWFAAVEARLEPRLQEMGAQIDRQAALMEALRQALAGRLDALEARDDQAGPALAGRVDTLTGQVERLMAATTAQETALGERIAALDARLTALETTGAGPALSETDLRSAVEPVLDQRMAGLETQVAALNEALQGLQAQLQGLGQAHTALEATVSAQVQQARADLEQRLGLLRSELTGLAGAALTPSPASSQTSKSGTPSAPPEEMEARLLQRLADQLNGRWQAEAETLRRRLKRLSFASAAGGALLLTAILVLAL